MKRFWLVLLSLGLVMAFSASAFAVDVKFSGSYFAGGMYLDKTSLTKDASTATAFYYQKLQLTTELVVAPGLSLYTRANVMDRIWGATRTAASTSLDTISAATKAENQNIGFDFLYAQFQTPVGMFKVGYQSNSSWGTIFTNSQTPTGGITWWIPVGKALIIPMYFKEGDKSKSNQYTTGISASDLDNDKYALAGIYIDKNIETGLIVVYWRQAANRDLGASAYLSKYYGVSPYVKATVGPVKIQAEFTYAFGDLFKLDSGTTGNAYEKLSSLTGWVDATATFGPVYVGGTFAYSQGQGDDANTRNQLLGGGVEWSPALIMWNQDRAYFNGTITSAAVGAASAFDSSMVNAFFYQLRAGVKPNDKLNIGAAVSMATADKNPAANWVSKDYGYEIDVTGTYKITNNLSYMLGVGYLITGDYFKGTSSANQVTNDYLVINKLTLTF